jgi:hypothetical protein
MQGQAELAAVRASVGLPDLSDTHALLALLESIAACENRLGTSLKCPERGYAVRAPSATIGLHQAIGKGGSHDPGSYRHLQDPDGVPAAAVSLQL